MQNELVLFLIENVKLKYRPIDSGHTKWLLLQLHDQNRLGTPHTDTHPKPKLKEKLVFAQIEFVFVKMIEL